MNEFEQIWLVYKLDNLYQLKFNSNGYIIVKIKQNWLQSVVFWLLLIG